MVTRKRRSGDGPPPRQHRATSAAARPQSVAHWSALEGADDSRYDGDDELMGIGAPLARHFGLRRLGIHHVRLLPGRRTSYPHAESAEEEFVFVLAGTPEVWLDGELHRLRPGDAVGFPAGTGLCHTFLNNTRREVRLLVVGEASKPENRVHYPRDPSQSRSPDFWHDPPPRPMGAHDGLPDRVRRARRARAR
jgi:uncharacterized cupin superfamily protein